LEEIGSFTLRAYEEYASKTTANAAGSGSPGRFFQQGNCIMEFFGLVSTTVFEDPWKDDPIQVCMFFLSIGWLNELLIFNKKYGSPT